MERLKKSLVAQLFCSFLTLLLISCNSDSRQQQEQEANRFQETGRNQSVNYDQQANTGELPEVNRMPQFTTSDDHASFGDEGIAQWEREVPEIEEVSIRSSADGKQEPALFYASGSEEEKPLLVVLHSWSSGYEQVIDIPYAQWAKEHDWVFIHPNYRGVFDKPEATGSELAIQDVMDAVAYAKENAKVDASRVYLVGFSGGGMAVLSLAARHPDIWAGVVAWGSVVDLLDWYEYNRQMPDRYYDEHIEASCGGVPEKGSEAADDCRQRSPVAHLSQSLDVPVYLGHGIEDELVPPSHSIRAFNLMAREEDRVSEDRIDYIVAESRLPASLRGSSEDSYFSGEEPEVLFIRESDNARLVLFDGGHNMVYNPGLLWLSEQQR